MSLVGRPGEKYFSHRSSLYTKLRFSLTFAPCVDRSFAVRPMRLFVGGHLSPVKGGRGRGRRCDGDRRPSSSGESVPRRGRGGGGGGKVEGTRGRGGEIGERPGRAAGEGGGATGRRCADYGRTHFTFSYRFWAGARAAPARPFLVCVPLNAAAVVIAVRGASIVVGMTAQSVTSDRGRETRGG